MIARLLLWLFWACRHRWETVATEEIEVPRLGMFIGVPQPVDCGTRYHLRCTQCGDVRKRDLV